MVDLVYPISGTTTPWCFISIVPYREDDDYGYVLGQSFFKSAYVVMNPETKELAIGVPNRNMTNSTILELGGTLSKSLSEIEGIDLLVAVQVDSGLSPNPSTSPVPVEPSGSGSSTNVGAIAGGVVGGVAVLGAIGAFFFFRQRKNAAAAPLGGAEMGEVPELPAAPVCELDGSEDTNRVYELHVEQAYAELPSNPPDGEHNAR
ncbi:hypothetical protein DRE_07769 [Drechslerella stenobrocha 248]|uniref:Peptidase A1 domain-containing protein n=1 Tax=Drechslerella stenobrocha 248 TaxID=1043628 RepID=W7I7L6_9PEZI|nr:hypothetical protein DRE_07769 [Drechslerella stenobrocha 248]